LVQPHGALRGVADGHVFGLAAGQCDGGLLLASPIDRTATQTNQPAKKPARLRLSLLLS
jgi:hypothetical protein